MLALGGGSAGCNLSPAEDAPRDRGATVLSGSPEERSELQSLYQEALARGEHQVYVFSTTGAWEWEKLWERFEQSFPGMQVIYSHISPAQVMPRMNAEAAAGKFYGDVYLLQANLAPTVAAGGYFASYTPSTVARLAARYHDEAGYLHYALAKVFGLVYNPALVDEAELPTRIEDVLAPRWHGRFAYIKPASGNGTSDIAIATLHAHQAITDEQLQGLMDNGSFGAIEAGIAYVSQGRQLLQLWGYLPTVIRQRELGAPVAIRFVPDFSINVPYAAAINKSSVRPYAARLLKAWLFTPDAQASLANDVGMLPLMPDAPVPQYYPEYMDESRALAPAELVEEVAAQFPKLQAIFNR